MRPMNRHGNNPALSVCSNSQRKSILKRESRLRATGDWGGWIIIPGSEARRFFPGATGWVTEIECAYKNDVFCVLKRFDKSGVTHLAISSLSSDRPTWYEAQRIKSEICGAEATAVEVYPPDSEIVDGSDMYHLWVLPEPLPFSLRKLEKSKATDAAGKLLEP